MHHIRQMHTQNTNQCSQLDSRKNREHKFTNCTTNLKIGHYSKSIKNNQRDGNWQYTFATVSLNQILLLNEPKLIQTCSCINNLVQFAFFEFIPTYTYLIRMTTKAVNTHKRRSKGRYRSSKLASPRMTLQRKAHLDIKYYKIWKQVLRVHI